MKLGNKIYFIFFFIFFFQIYSFAEDKITTTPLINIEKLKPSFEETEEEKKILFQNKI